MARRRARWTAPSPITGRIWKSRGQGDFTAPADGTHGWYFLNKGEMPVKVTVKTVDFYKDLFLPKAE
jgi:hypothetical protein